MERYPALAALRASAATSTRPCAVTNSRFIFRGEQYAMHAPIRIPRSMFTHTLRSIAMIALLARVSLSFGQALPEPVLQALREADVPLENVGVYVAEANSGQAVIAHRADRPMNPASVMKLITTYAALELLGPAFTFKTEVFAAPSKGDVVQGNVVLKGHGDPKLTLEDFWLLLRALRARGVREIRGDLVLDNSYFDLPSSDQNGFDNRSYRAYNTSPEATMISFKSVTVRFVPDPVRGTVRVFADPELADVKLQAAVKLRHGACPFDWREGITKDVDGSPDKPVISVSGAFAADCGEKALEFSVLSNSRYVAAVFRLLWRELGGSFAGKVREATAPAGVQPLLSWESPPLSELVRDINKWSNNVMARQVFLTLGAEPLGTSGTPEAGGRAVARWLAQKTFDFPELVLENGSGLSRTERISAGHLGQLLVSAFQSPVMPEMTASLPIIAVDGTMKKRLKNSSVAGRGHIKTGTLEGVKAIAGYVQAISGRRFAVVCMVNHPRAAAAESAMDALLSWVYEKN
jgi:serine-type D-Ala-D-Ala carboxypeptidase/endopeptidase (penicillin-binding protein 4)